jgi:four helix bundle protein
MNKIKSFTDLNTWKEGHKLVLMIYKITRKFPKEEKYSLVDQMRRAVVSITSNIAEGFSRKSYTEKLQFYCMSQGSLTELQNQILVARDVGYLNNSDFELLATQAVVVHKLISGLIKKTKNIRDS